MVRQVFSQNRSRRSGKVFLKENGLSTLVECVPNFSEGRDAAKVDAIVAALCSVPGVALLDR